MTRTKQLRKKLRWTVKQFATFIEVNERTVRRWESGETPTPKVVTLLLKVLVKYSRSLKTCPSTLIEVLALLDLTSDTEDGKVLVD